MINIPISHINREKILIITFIKFLLKKKKKDSNFSYVVFDSSSHEDTKNLIFNLQKYKTKQIHKLSKKKKVKPINFQVYK